MVNPFGFLFSVLSFQFSVLSLPFDRTPRPASKNHASLPCFMCQGKPGPSGDTISCGAAIVAVTVHGQSLS
jgi:hypothetical protein